MEIIEIILDLLELIIFNGLSERMDENNDLRRGF